eukprot:TRINITY_DN2855_c0_g1_i2.p1 TRINITY_DN2855_c0_g1~~TRINITY_DN2855_c0_g1_i2.p1  ORF type:complete len:1932 (-),score=539.22 TRINITY_DN2855_c0_g1_i2:115-5910(-)
MGNKLGIKQGKEINSKKFEEIFKKFSNKKDKINKEVALKFLKSLAEEAQIEYLEYEALDALKKIDPKEEGLDYEKFKQFFIESNEEAINKGDLKLSQSMMGSSLKLQKEDTTNITNNTNIKDKKDEMPKQKEDTTNITNNTNMNDKKDEMPKYKEEKGDKYFEMGSNSDVSSYSNNNYLSPQNPSNYIIQPRISLSPSLPTTTLISQEEHNFDIALSDSSNEEISNNDSSQEGEEKIEDNNSVEKLSEENVKKLLSRAKDIEKEEDDEKEFHVRESSIKAPKTGKRIEVPFPPPSTELPPETLDPKKLKELLQQEVVDLKIERYSPTGELNAVPALSITFNQPMIALSSVSEVEMMDVPAVLEPKVPGKWVWKGTQTLQFEPTHRFPKSTHYTVSISKGAKSLAGGVLKENFSFKFSTKVVGIVEQYPKNGVIVPDLKPFFFFGFDQKIDQKTLLSIAKLRSSDSKYKHKIELMSEEEVKNHNILKFLHSASLPGQWVAFKLASTKEELQKNTHYNLILEPEVPSAEGSRKTTGPLEINFRTYPPLSLRKYSPDTNTYKAKPKGTWTLYFTNQLDQNTVNKSLISIKPECEGVAIISSGDSITLRNFSKANTEYTVKISGDLKDVFGQSFTGANLVKFKIGERTPCPSFSALSGMNIFDPVISPPIYSAVIYEYKKILVKIYQVKPSDYMSCPLVTSSSVTKYKEKNTPLGFGKIVFEGPIDCPIGDDPSVPYNLSIDLRKYLQFGNKNIGQLFISMEPEKNEFARLNPTSKYEYREITWAWIQCTRLGINIFTSKDPSLKSYAIISELSDGSPIKNALFEWNGESGQSDEHGLVKINTKYTTTNNLAIAYLDDDIAFYNGASNNPIVTNQVVFFSFDDRKLYKPKEEVRIKGYFRVLTHLNGSVVPQYCTDSEISYSVLDPRGETLIKDKIKLSKFGSFDIKFTLKDNVNLGTGSVKFNRQSDSSTYTHTFQIQEFRRPEFEANCSYAPVTRHVSSNDIGGFAVSTAKASYFAGGPLNGAKVSWTVNAKQASYSPPGLYQYSYGKTRSWWLSLDTKNQDFGTWRHEGTTDLNGEHNLKIQYVGNFTKLNPTPITISANCSVQDINYQTMSSSTSILLHPSNYYVGYKAQRKFCKPGQTIPIEVVVSNADGKLLDKIEVKVTITRTWHEQTQDERGLEKVEKKTEITNTTLTSSSDKNKPVVLNFEGKKSGEYEFEFTVQDERLRSNTSVLSDFTVSGGFNPRKYANNKKITSETVSIIPNKKSYEAGEVAEVLIVSPFSPAHGVLTVDCEGVEHLETFELKDDSDIFNFKIKKEWIPGATIQVQLNGSQFRTNDIGIAQKNAPKRPAFASGSIRFDVSEKFYELDVEVTPSKKKTGPSTELSVDVVVKDKKGELKSNVEVCIVVVDESVLALAGYQLTNPLSLFYKQRVSGQTNFNTRTNVILFDMEDLKDLAESELIIPVIKKELVIRSENNCCSLQNRCLENCCSDRQRCRYKKKCSENISRSSCCSMPSSPKCSLNCPSPPPQMSQSPLPPPGEGALDNSTPIGVRTNFDALANFSPSQVTNNKGFATIKFKLPDNLTRYRVWALAADDKYYGLGESDISASLPLMVRPSLPRFLNFGDEADVNVVVQNQTDESLNVVIAMRCTNATIREGTGGYNFTLKPAGRINLLFPLATNYCGVARIQTVVAAGNFADSSENQVPIFTPSTSEAFATYGDVEESGIVLQEIKPPSEVYKQFGGLEISTSTTALQSLTDAVLYLYNYSFECNEQLASRVIGVGSLRDVLVAFKVKGSPTESEINNALSNGLSILKKRQWPSGGFSYWEPNNYSEESVFVSCNVAHCLAICKQKKISYDVKVWEKLKPFILNLEKYMKHWYSDITINSLKAFSYYVLTKYGDDVVIDAQNLLKKGIEAFSFEALCNSRTLFCCFR